MTFQNLRKGTFATILALSMILSIFSGCSQPQVSTDPYAPTSPTENIPLVTDPPATTPADGNPDDVTCLGTYTVSDADAKAAADTVVASITLTKTQIVEKTPVPTETEAVVETTAPAGTESAAEASSETTVPTASEAPTGTEPAPEPSVEYEEVTITEEYTLTNGQLQAYYWMEVAAYREAGHDVVPDFSQDLATQVCPIDDTVGSWQQYFLHSALNTWASSQALILWGQEEGIPLEEAYKIKEDLHAKHLVNIPATDLLYGYNGTAYRPNSQHQAFLDNIPAMVEAVAAENGFATSDELTLDLVGAGASAEDLLSYIETTNRGYMFLTELGYHMEDVTAEEVEAYFTQHEAEYAAEGITRDSGKYVDMRHILRIPENATIAEDGTVTADDSEWQRLDWDTKALNMEIQATYPYTEGVFARYATNKSMDSGSALNGGLYENLTQGQLIAELDTWLFDSAREPGDVTMIRTELGIHIVYFSSSTEIWYAEAEKDLLSQKYQQTIDRAKEAYPAQIDYSAVRLGAARQTCAELTEADLLYADVAHERYPEAPVYLQQDYQSTRYGGYSIVTHGCGITTLAMLATYMTDQAYTPPVMCSMFGRYCSEQGTDRTLFVNETADLGFYMYKQTADLDAAYEALQQGYIVVNLQLKGYWTRGGHYLLLEELTEDGNVVIRDSNIYNYNKLEGHFVDNFEWKYIPGASETFFIFHPKQVTHPHCTRCADETDVEGPSLLLQGDYQCSRCDNALARRNAFLNY